MSLIFFNRSFEKNRLKALVLWNLSQSKEKNTIDLLEKLKQIGFSFATYAGVSLSIDDLKIPPNKGELLVESQKALNLSKKEYEKGNITAVESFQQIIDLWYRTSEVLKQNVIQHFRSTDILNPVYMMAFSGARGNISQVRQLVGMRGLMADPQGQILDFPIRSNFREGLTLTEYIISCYGARKGLVDTALRTANAGYLTRRLVDVAQHIIIRETNCKTDTGIFLTDMKDGNKTKVQLQKRLVGRVLGEDIESIAKKNQDIYPLLAFKIVEKRNKVCVRSPLTCKTKKPICQLCYGWSLAYGKLVSKGEAVGVLAAQSIGEPGTQLTMRTFHTGGVFSGDVIEEIKAPFNGVINYENPLQGTLIRTLYGKIAFLTKNKGNFSISDNKITNKFSIPLSTILFARQKETVYKKQLLAEYSSTFTKKTKGIKEKYNITSNFEGQVYFENVLLLITVGKKGDITKTALRLGSIWVVSGNIYQSIIPSKLFIKANDLVNTNSILDQSILLSPYDGFLKSNNLKEKTIKKFKNDLNKDLNKTEALKNFFNTNIQKNKKFQQKKIQDFFLSSPLLVLSIKNINYKKFGYFLSLYNLFSYKVLLSISLNNNFTNLKKINFQFFHEKKINEFIFFEKQNITNFLLEGEFFSLSEKNFIFKRKENLNLFFLSSKEKKTLTNKTFYRIIQTNQQTKKIHLFEYLFYEKNINFFKKQKNNLNHKIKNLIKNIFLFLIINKKKYTFIKKNQFKFINLPTLNKKYNQIKRKKNFFLKNQIQLNFFKKKKRTYKTIKKNSLFKLKIKLGWLFLEKRTKVFIVKNQTLLLPGQVLSKKIFLDQHFIFLEHIPFNKTFLFFKYEKSFIQTRFIKNKKFKIKKLKSFLKYKKNISRNLLYKKNFIYITFIISLLRKGIENKNIPIFLKKNFFSNEIKNFSHLKSFDITSIFLNKQYKGKLRLNYPSINLDIKKNFYPSLKNKKSIKKNIFCNFNISFDGFEKKNLQKSKTEYKIGLILIIFSVQRINFLNSIFKKKEKNNYLRKNTTKIYINKNKQIIEKLSPTVNSFFSPYDGEIIKTKIDNLGKQKTLILTSKNQISFPLKNNLTFFTIGQFVRYGENFSDNFGILESGQVIQIDKKKITLRKAQPFLFGSKGIFLINHDDVIENKTPLITLFYRKIKTEDIIQGIPRIEEIFEARQPKEGDIISENLNMKLKFFFYWYSEKKNLSFQESAKISIQRIQTIIVNRIQKVYQSQGVDIADKHIEIIVRQMTGKVKIIVGGAFLRGELISLRKVERKNRNIEYTQNLNSVLKEYLKLQKIYRPSIKKVIYEPIILGITKAALETETESFLSAASFQETTKILSQAALQKKLDFLVGLKENVILGRLIPAGTGSFQKKEKEIKNEIFLKNFNSFLKKHKKLFWLNKNQNINILKKK
uniref:DNA-directed RNA polymerase subunit beta'' n=1 Tax=Neglectella solitaria TaxID=120749 RepID=C7BEC5_NEGSO|nr:beta'' subunit of RNA polymerase [Neglectella solitaria]